MSGCSPWNENDDVRAATCSPSMRESELSNSSVSPSEKYSWLGSPLMFTNGSTAMEWGGGEKATALVGVAFAGSPDCDGASTRAPVMLAPERARQSAYTPVRSVAAASAAIRARAGNRGRRTGAIVITVDEVAPSRAAG